MANLTKSLELMADLIKAFDGEAPFKQHLATDRALATVKPAPKEPVAPVVPEHEQKLAAAHAKIEELKGLLKQGLHHVKQFQGKWATPEDAATPGHPIHGWKALAEHSLK